MESHKATEDHMANMGHGASFAWTFDENHGTDLGTGLVLGVLIVSFDVKIGY